jgi:hypothetical protein
MEGQAGWRSLGEWALAFALLAVAVLGALSIGVFVLPVAVAALAFAARRNRRWPEPALGALIGVGVVCLYVAFRGRDYSPCPPSGTPMRLGPGERFTCGGLDPVPWLAVGLVLGAVGLLGYLALRRAHREIAA